MGNGEKPLAPTLWRTCRALLNPLRLNLLRMVFDHDDTYTVTDFARALGIEQSTATIYLRQLNARGLIGVRRQRIKVFYNTNPDRSLPEALSIRETMRKLFAGQLDEEWVAEFMTILRAFSHFNRLAMLGRLIRGPATISELSEAAGVCVKSLYHHLRFLNSAELLVVSGSHRQPSMISLREQVPPLAAALLSVLSGEKAKGRTYRNDANHEIPDAATKSVLRKIARSEGDPAKHWREKSVMKPRCGRMKSVDRKAHIEVEGN